jgi:hypothetical protein
MIDDRPTAPETDVLWFTISAVESPNDPACLTRSIHASDDTAARPHASGNTNSAVTIPNRVPEAGDVLISKRAASPVYELSCVPGPPQLVEYTYDAAVARACQIAERQSVDVWHTLDQTHTVRVARYRTAREST